MTNFITDVRGFLVNRIDSASYIDATAGVRFEMEYSASLEVPPTKATLTSLLPEATTGSMYIVGSGSESWIAFKDVKGIWRTVTASFAA